MKPDAEFKEYSLKFRSIEELTRKSAILQRIGAVYRKNTLRYFHDNNIKFQQLGSKFLIDMNQEIDTEALKKQLEENDIEKIIDALNKGEIQDA